MVQGQPETFCGGKTDIEQAVERQQQGWASSVRSVNIQAMG